MENFIVFFIRNLNEALTGDESLSHWTKDLWENVLQDETFFAFMDESDSLNSVDEISLFKHLVRYVVAILSEVKSFRSFRRLSI